MAIKSVEAESDTYTDVDISGLLNSGTCQLRIIVTGDQTQSTTTSTIRAQNKVLIFNTLSTTKQNKRTIREHKRKVLIQICILFSNPNKMG